MERIYYRLLKKVQDEFVLKPILALMKDKYFWLFICESLVFFITTIFLCLKLNMESKNSILMMIYLIVYSFVAFLTGGRIQYVKDLRTNNINSKGILEIFKECNIAPKLKNVEMLLSKVEYHRNEIKENISVKVRGVITICSIILGSFFFSVFLPVLQKSLSFSSIMNVGDEHTLSMYLDLFIITVNLLVIFVFAYPIFKYLLFHNMDRMQDKLLEAKWKIENK